MVNIRPNRRRGHCCAEFLPSCFRKKFICKSTFNAGRTAQPAETSAWFAALLNIFHNEIIVAVLVVDHAHAARPPARAEHVDPDATVPHKCRLHSTNHVAARPPCKRDHLWRDCRSGESESAWLGDSGAPFYAAPYLARWNKTQHQNSLRFGDRCVIHQRHKAAAVSRARSILSSTSSSRRKTFHSRV